MLLVGAEIAVELAALDRESAGAALPGTLGSLLLGGRAEAWQGRAR